MLGVGIFRVTAGYSKAQIITVSENEALKELLSSVPIPPVADGLLLSTVFWGAVAFKAAMELGRGMGIRQECHKACSFAEVQPFFSL